MRSHIEPRTPDSPEDPAATTPLSLTVRKVGSERPFTVTIDVPEATIGRASTCDVRLPFPVVSSHHLTLREIDGTWQVIDVGSTNGTLLEGFKLPVDRPVILEDGMTLQIVDVTMELGLGLPRGEGFTLAQSGTMVRQMISEALGRAADTDDLAFLEIVSGPGAGRRATIDDAIDEAWLGSAADGVLLTVRDVTVPKRAVRIYRHDDGFVLAPADHATVLLDGEAMRAPARLRSGARVVLGTVELVFFDPLESYLDELEGLGMPPRPHAASTPLLDASEEVLAAADPNEGVDPIYSYAGGDVAASSDAETAAGSTTEVAADGDGAAGLRRLGAIEKALLVASLLILVIGVAAVLLFLDIL